MRTDSSTTLTRLKSVLVAGRLALSVGACGSGNGTQAGGTTPSSPPATTPATSSATMTSNPVQCADAAALRASVERLTNITVQPGLADEIEADLEDVQSKLATLTNDARGEYQDEISALQSALATLATTVKDLAANSDSAAVSAVSAALQQVRTAGEDLLEAVGTRCPLLSPSISPS